MKPLTMLAIGAGVVLGAALLSGRGGGRSVSVIGQGFDANGHVTPWASTRLGNGTTSFAAGACVLCALCQAWSKFNPDSPQMDPRVANDALKQAGAFGPGSSSMDSVKGANALGMDKPANFAISFDGQGVPTPGHIQQMRAMLDSILQHGGVPLVRVDHDRDIGLVGDHTMSVLSGGGGVYNAADPALARMITLDANLQGKAGIGWGAHLPYQVVGVSGLFNV